LPALFREHNRAARQTQLPATPTEHRSIGPATKPESNSFADRNKQGIVALSTGIGVQALGNFKSYVLDRGRLGVAAAQEMRGGQARWAPLLLGVGGGIGLTGFGLYNLRRVAQDGISNVFSPRWSTRGWRSWCRRRGDCTWRAQGLA